MKVALKVKQPLISMMLSKQKKVFFVGDKSDHNGTVNIIDDGIDYELCKKYNIDPSKITSHKGCIYCIANFYVQKKSNRTEYVAKSHQHYQNDTFDEYYYYTIKYAKQIPMIHYIEDFGEPEVFDKVFLKTSLAFEDCVMSRNIGEEFKSPISTVFKDSTSDYCWQCHFPICVNPYLGCNHNCTYCLVRYTYGYNGMFTTDPVPSNPEIVRRALMDGLHTTKDNILSNIIRKKGAIKMSVSCDPFPAVELKHRVSLEILKLFKEEQYPYVIITKSIIPSRPEYLNEIDGSVMLYQQSLPFFDDKIARILEPGAPTVSQRIKSMEKIKDQTDADVQVRLEPFMLGLSYNLDGSIDTKYYMDYFRTLRDIGVSTVSVRDYLGNPMTNRPLQEATKQIADLAINGELDYCHDFWKTYPEGINYTEVFRNSWTRIFGETKNKQFDCVEKLIYAKAATKLKILAKAYGIDLVVRNNNLVESTNKTICCSLDHLSTKKQNVFFGGLNYVPFNKLYKRLKEEGSLSMEELIDEGIFKPYDEELLKQKFEEGSVTEGCYFASPITNGDKIEYVRYVDPKKNYIDSVKKARKENSNDANKRKYKNGKVKITNKN